VTLRYRTLMTITAVGLGLALGWGLGMQPIHAQTAKASDKKWQGKDGGQEEFGLAQAMDKATDPKAKIEALDKWKTAFPKSDFDDIRQEAYLGAYQAANMNRQAFDKALEILKTNPNNFYALRAIVSLAQTLMPPTPADLDNVGRISMYIMDNADTAFAAANRPQNITEAQWPAIKPAMKAAAQKQALDYITKTYTAYHGSSQGLPELLAMAKTNAFPPEGFTIDSTSDIAIKKAQAQAAADAANPIFAFWRDLVKEPLIMMGDSYFDQNMKGALLPGDPGKAKGFEKFKAKLVSMTPANKPKQLVLALEKPDVPDVTLKFEEPLAGNMEPGAILEFEGVPDAYTKEPFMVTFLVTPDQLTGWTGTNPKGGARGAGKGRAGKGTKAKQ
jgi:hypothetical protein